MAKKKTKEKAAPSNGATVAKESSPAATGKQEFEKTRQPPEAGSGKPMGT